MEADRVEGQCFCYICQLIGRSSWERLCGEQTWPTMRELKEKAEARVRLFFLWNRAARGTRTIFLFSE